MENKKPIFQTDGEIFPYGNAELRINTGAWNNSEDNQFEFIAPVLLKFDTKKLTNKCYYDYSNDLYQQILAIEHSDDGSLEVMCYGAKTLEIDTKWSYICFTPFSVIEYLMRRIGIWEDNMKSQGIDREILRFSTKKFVNENHTMESHKCEYQPFCKHNKIREIKLTQKANNKFYTEVKTQNSKDFIYSIGESALIIEYLMRRIGIWKNDGIS